MRIVFRVTMGVFICVFLLGNVSTIRAGKFPIEENNSHENKHFDTDILPGIEAGASILSPCPPGDAPEGVTVNCDVYEGRLEVLNEPERKFLLHLEGNHYQMGYQHGYLLAPIIEDAIDEATVEMVKVFFKNQVVPQWVLDLFTNASGAFFASYASAIPERYRHEIRGIVDGVIQAAIDRGETPPNGYKLFYDIIKLNLGPDVASVLSSITWLDNDKYKKGANFFEDEWYGPPHSCDAFVVTGEATAAKNKTIMGRNFMYLDKPWWKYGIIIEYYPRDTYINGEPVDEIPHVSVGMAGLVGVSTGMNLEGLGIGQNLVQSLDSDWQNVGMGASIASRIAIAENKDLEGAKNSILNTKLGAPWIFTIADGKGTIGALAIEKAKEKSTVRKITDPDPEFLDQLHVDKKIGEDLLITSNFFLKRDMYDAKVAVIGNARYNELLSRVNKAIKKGGVCFDTSSETSEDGCADICSGLSEDECEIKDRNGGGLVNYLRHWGDNPEKDPGTGLAVYPNRELMATSVTLFDLTETKMKTKYSKYSHKWVNYQFSHNP